MKKIISVIVLLTLLLPLWGVKKDKNAFQKNSLHNVFTNLKKEYKLASYFITSKQKRYYKKLSKKEKWIFLQAFWKNYDPNPVTPTNEYIELLKERIIYCNKHFSHFKPGWETDRGRIFIKIGKPFDIVEGETSSFAKYSDKKYQIWKYRLDRNSTYIFIDKLSHGNFRLIYSEGDDKEITLPDWRSYFDRNFDFSVLE